MPYPNHSQKAIAKVWTMPSSSNFCTYETLLYSDGSTSCNCPGWVRRVTVTGGRSCKHTRMVDMGIADGVATTFMDYRVEPQQQQERKDNAKTKDRTENTSVGKFKRRIV
jgi:hypothetical protein